MKPQTNIIQNQNQRIALLEHKLLGHRQHIVKLYTYLFIQTLLWVLIVLGIGSYYLIQYLNSL